LACCGRGSLPVALSGDVRGREEYLHFGPDRPMPTVLQPVRLPCVMV
jgi:hypothetical protein